MEESIINSQISLFLPQNVNRSLYKNYCQHGNLVPQVMGPKKGVKLQIDFKIASQNQQISVRP